MKYTIKAKQTRYAGVLFRSRLEARYAAFFDIIGWEWQYEPVDLSDWSPDFYVRFPCRHSECSGYHDLLVEVKPYKDQSMFDRHPCRKHNEWDSLCHPEFRTCATAGFGLEPWNATWNMCHGSGAGEDCIGNWVYGDFPPYGYEESVRNAWARAGNAVYWQFDQRGNRTR